MNKGLITADLLYVHRHLAEHFGVVKSFLREDERMKIDGCLDYIKSAIQLVNEEKKK